MYRDELIYSDKQLIEIVWEAYRIKIKNLSFIDSGSFFGFVAEQADNHKLFIKVYPKSTIMGPSLISKDSLNEIGLALQRFRNEFGIEKLSFCIPNRNNQYCYETNELLLIVFDHIEGFHPSYAPNLLSANKLAQIFYQLHTIPYEEFSNLKKEDFNIDYALGLENCINYKELPNSTLIKPMISLLTTQKQRLLNHLNELKDWQKKYSKQPLKQVITHGDPHHYNVLQTSKDLWLIDWDGLKIGPAERDLWHYEEAPLIDEYQELDPTFKLNHELCAFYQRQRFFEDIRYYFEQVLLKANSSEAQDKKDVQNFLGHWGWNSDYDK